MTLVDLLLWGGAAVLLLPVAILVVECTAALVPGRSSRSAQPGKRPVAAVVIPAHNEESVIAQTVRLVRQQLTEEDCLVVVADNCTDETAALARQAGAEIIERRDPERKGKGYALDYAIRWLEANPPEVVLIIDADCAPDDGAIDRVVETAARTNRPVQAAYLLEPSAQGDPIGNLSALAFLVRNLGRPAGLHRLGMPCLLTGSGMAFPWAVIRDARLATANIVEDMQLGIDLTLAGHPPCFCEAARVLGAVPVHADATRSQRTRWEHGHLRTLLSQVPRLLGAGWTQSGFTGRLALALDLSVPPLSLLMMVLGIGVLAATAAGLLAASWGPLWALGTGLALVVLSVMGVWARYARSLIRFRLLLVAPFYVLWKLPIYLFFLVRPQRSWVRTERDTSG